MDVNSCLVFSVFVISTFISCSLSERECGRLEYPLNGRVNVDTYRVGGIARYSCNKGYRLQGHSAALCLSNGEFDPSHTPICRPVMCDEVYHFENGNIQHINDGRQSYSYMTINMYRCDPGFRIKGPSNRRCGGDGEWEGDDPFCQEITCVPLGPLFNGEIDYSERRRTWGTVAIFTCNTDSDLFPSDKDMAMCEETGEWSDSAPECFRKAIIGPTTRGYVYVDRSSSPLRQRKSVKHGTKVRLTCDSRSELYSNVPYRRYINQGYVISRNYNGTWTPALSECVFKRCDLRERKYGRYKFTFINGTAAPAKVDHNTELHGRCITDFEFEEEHDETPSVFTCNKGNIVLEQRCVPAFCSVSLAADMYLDTGTTEIIDDIERIRHRTKIYYRCSNDREYELFFKGYTDSVSDSCSYGKWEKKVTPVCKEKRCYLRVNEGAVFSYDHEQNSIIYSNTYIESRMDIHIKCQIGFRMVEDGSPIPSDMLNRYSTCSKGKWSRNIRCEPEPCYLDLQNFEDALLYDDHNSAIESSRSIESGKSIRIDCIDGYRMVESGQPVHHEKSLTCSEGTWSSTNLKCEPAPCEFVKRVGSDFWLEKDGNRHFLNTRKLIKSNTRVYIRCHTGYRLTLTRGHPVTGELIKHFDCYRGRWNRIYECEEVWCGPGQWQCSDGQCIDVAQRCDSYPDCEDESDEVCDVTVCNEGLVACPQPNGFTKCVEDTIGCAPCDFTKRAGSDFWLLKDGKKQTLKESGPIESNTQVFISCHDGYKLTLKKGEAVTGKGHKYCKCVSGEWSPIYICDKDGTKNEETTTETASHNYSNMSTLSQNTSDTIYMAESQQPTSIETEATNHPGETAHEADNNTVPTTVAAIATVLKTEQVQNDSTEYAYSTTTLAYDGSESDFVSAVTNAQVYSTMERFNETLTIEGCSLPTLNADVYQIPGDYLPGENVLHGYSFDIACWDNYDIMDNVTVICNDGALENMPTCEDDIGSEGRPDCYIANGLAIRLDVPPSLYDVSCNHGYKLNASAQLFTCRDGHLYPDGSDHGLNSSTEHVECLPENCPLLNLPSGMKVQNKKGVYYSRGSEISHKEKINVTCQEGFEPYGREFKCYAGSLRPISEDWHFETVRNANETLDCRKAKCSSGCGSGVCILDDTCRCDDGHYGTHCEKAYCRLPDGIQHQKFKGFYSEDTKLYDLTCTNRNAQYHGPSPLVCLSNGTWSEQPSCHVKQLTEYRIHFVGYNWKKTEVRELQERTITVYGDGSQTTKSLLHLEETYRELNSRIYVFKFQAEDIDHVHTIRLTSPFEQKWIRKIKLELRNKAVVYFSPTEGILLEQGREYSYPLTIRKEYSQTFGFKNGVLPKLIQKWKKYIHINSDQLCQFKCTQETAFTCAAILLTSSKPVCYLFSYSTIDHPKYFIYYRYIADKFYERQYFALP